jgi:hypothetical protein
MSRRPPILIVGLFLLALMLSIRVLRQDRFRTDGRTKLADTQGTPTALILAADKLADNGAVVVPELVAALDADRAEVRAAAAVGLRRLGVVAKAAAPRLTELLRDDDPVVRSNCASALAEVLPDRLQAAAVLAPMLADDDPEVRQTVSEELAQLGRFAAPAVSAFLRSSNHPEGRCEAMRLLLRVGDGRFRTAALIREALNGAAAGSRVYDTALDGLLKLEAATAQELELALFGSNRQLALSAIDCRSECCDWHEHTLLLIRLLDAAAPDLHQAVVGNMLFTDRDLQTARPRLEELLKSESGRDATTVAQLLLKIDSHSAPATAHLKGAAQDFDSDVSAQAAWALKNAAAVERSDVVAAAKRAATDPSAARRIRALRVLGYSAEGVDAIVGGLHDPEGTVRAAARDALCALGADAAPAVPHLVRILEDQYTRGDQVDRSLIWVLQCIGPPARAAGPLLETLARETLPGPGKVVPIDEIPLWALVVETMAHLEIESADVASAVVRLAGGLHAHEASLSSLRGLGVPANVAVPLLREALFSPDDRTSIAACNALGAYGRESAAATEDLVALLHEGSRWRRWPAVAALKEIGPPARAAVPALQALLSAQPPEPAPCEGSPLQQSTGARAEKGGTNMFDSSFPVLIRRTLYSIESENDARTESSGE